MEQLVQNTASLQSAQLGCVFTDDRDIFVALLSGEVTFTVRQCTQESVILVGGEIISESNQRHTE